MAKALLALAFVAWIANAQAIRIKGVSVEYYRSTSPELFHNCADVEATAKTLAKEVTDRIYVLELYPTDQHAPIAPFVSDVGLSPQADGWINSYRTTLPPVGLLYSVDGKYAFQCRDDQGHMIKSHGPDGDPLQLKLPDGEAEILYFSRTPQGMTYAFIITNKALDEINGDDLMAQVKQRLSTHFSFICVRNDPWFLGYSVDSGPYIFADQYKPITEKEYHESKTIVCRTDIGCRVSRSSEW